MECPVKNDGINNLFLSCILIYISFPSFSWDTRWRSWLRNCATSWEVAGSIPDYVIGIFCRTMALGSREPLTEMSTRNISWRIRRPMPKLTTLPPTCADFLEILGASNSWKPQGLSRPVQGYIFAFLFFLIPFSSFILMHAAEVPCWVGVDGIAIRHELDSPEIESRWEQNYPCPSRPTQTVFCNASFSGVGRQGCNADRRSPSSGAIANGKELYFRLPSVPA
jgi:hypothetical protein